MNSERKPAGRPRNPETDGKVLQITRHLVASRGYADVTIAEIAVQAGIGRQTLYRRWPSKAEIVLDALFESASTADLENYERLEPSLVEFLTRLFRHLERDGAALRNLIASAQSDAGFLKHFRERFAKPRETAMRSILDRAIESGELPAGTDVDTAVDMLHGAFWYRLLLGEPLDRACAIRLARAIVPSR
ncbi:TetR/AcrR family transcriptional regulator [Novosphingobium sp.]|uniref:TetR/AcrR family transcriptional regulator n=1 Tax=Novosphingobium sp. TaxID=1874826 RepID=UPI0028A5EFE6|nr:TetR/AcrR family transcriptional regulator [Novosphingobium sp.]